MGRTQALRHAIAVVLLACGCAAGASAMAQAVLGKSKYELDGTSATLCRHEAALGNVVANALKEGAAADLALINCAAIKGARIFPANTELTLEDAQQILPQGKLAVLEVTGVDLLTILEQAVSTFGQDDGRFPQVSGIRMVVDPKRPAGQRIVKVTVNGEALDFARSYRVATSDELATGGLGYAAFAAMKSLISAEGAQALSDVLANYVRREGMLDVKTWGRIQVAE